MDTPAPASSSEPGRPRRRRHPSPRAPTDMYVIKRQLAKGHNAVVYLVEHNADPKPLAMKKIPRNNKRTENMNRLRANNPARAGASSGAAPLPRTSDPTVLVDRRGTEETKIRREIAIMKKCDHPNIIKFFAYIDDSMSANVCLIMEYMEGGELQWHIDSEPYLTMEQTRRVMRDVVLGLEYLHLQDIIHRDIKPSNIMWTADRSHVKIGDFGVAHLAAVDDELGDSDGPRHAGTPAFLAPEIAPGFEGPMGEVTPAVDLWALGVTLYCLLFGRMPFEPRSDVAGHVAAEASLYRAIREDPWGPRDTMSSQRVAVHSADWKRGGVLHLLDHLLRKDPAQRFGIDDVKASTDNLQWPGGSQKSSGWLLTGVQRREEWVQGTRPRIAKPERASLPKIAISKVDEANAILEPKFKWNLRRVVGRQFSKFFRTSREPPEPDDGSKGAVKSEPSISTRYHRPKEKDRDVDRHRERDQSKGKGKARAPIESPPARRARLFPWRGRESPPPPLPQLQQPAVQRRGVFGGLVSAARYSEELLGSAPVSARSQLAVEQRTTSMTNARTALPESEDWDGDGAEGEPGAAIIGTGMITAPRAVEGDESESGSACSYGSGARTRGEYDLDDGEKDYGEAYADEEGDRPPRDVYVDTNSGDEDGPIEFKRKSTQVRLGPRRKPREKEKGTRYPAPPESDSEQDDDASLTTT